MALCGFGSGNDCGPGFIPDENGMCICVQECKENEVQTIDCTCKSCEGQIALRGDITLVCDFTLYDSNTVRVLGPTANFAALLNGRPCTIKSYSINGALNPVLRDILPCSFDNEYVVEMELDCDGCKRTHTYIERLGSNALCCPQGKSYRCDPGLGCSEIDGLSGYETIELCQAAEGCQPCKLKYTDIELALYDLTCQECITENGEAKLQYTYNDDIECCQLSTVRTIGEECDLPSGGKGVYNEFCNCVSDDLFGYKWACVTGIGGNNPGSRCFATANGIYDGEPECCEANPFCCIDGTGNPTTALPCHRYSLRSNNNQVTATVKYNDCDGVNRTISTTLQQSGFPTVFCGKEVTYTSETAVVSSFPYQICTG